MVQNVSSLEQSSGNSANLRRRTRAEATGDCAHPGADSGARRPKGPAAARLGQQGSPSHRVRPGTLGHRCGERSEPWAAPWAGPQGPRRVGISSGQPRCGPAAACSLFVPATPMRRAVWVTGRAGEPLPAGPTGGTCGLHPGRLPPSRPARPRRLPAGGSGSARLNQARFGRHRSPAATQIQAIIQVSWARAATLSDPARSPSGWV